MTDYWSMGLIGLATWIYLVYPAAAEAETGDLWIWLAVDKRAVVPLWLAQVASWISIAPREVVANHCKVENNATIVRHAVVVIQIKREVSILIESEYITIVLSMHRTRWQENHGHDNDSCMNRALVSLPMTMRTAMRRERDTVSSFKSCVLLLFLCVGMIK